MSRSLSCLRRGAELPPELRGLRRRVLDSGSSGHAGFVVTVDRARFVEVELAAARVRRKPKHDAALLWFAQEVAAKLRHPLPGLHDLTERVLEAAADAVVWSAPASATPRSFRTVHGGLPERRR